MEKKNSKNKWLAIASGLAAFAVMFLLFSDAVTMEFNGNKAALSGMDVMFGYKEKYYGTSYQFFGFSIMIFLTFLIGIAGIVFLCLGARANAKVAFKYVAIGCLAVSGALCFCMSSFVVQGNGLEKFYEDVFSFSGETNKMACEIVMSCLKTAFGAILGGVALIGAAAFCLVDVITAKKEAVMQSVAPVVEEAAMAAEPNEAPVAEETEEKAE